MPVTVKHRGYQRCPQIDYRDAWNAFAITLCVGPRRPVFCTSESNHAMVNEIQRLHEDLFWHVHVYCIMPDHVHLVVRPGSPGLSEAVRRFKGRLTAWWRKNGDGRPLWQAGYFDHRIRSSESFDEKCEYVLQNPVRAGLVKNPEEYPWAGQLNLNVKVEPTLCRLPHHSRRKVGSTSPTRP